MDMDAGRTSCIYFPDQSYEPWWALYEPMDFAIDMTKDPNSWLFICSTNQKVGVGENRVILQSITGVLRSDIASMPLKERLEVIEGGKQYATEKLHESLKQKHSVDRSAIPDLEATVDAVKEIGFHEKKRTIINE